MAKKSLIISDKEKYGGDNSMGAMIATSGKGKAKDQPKHAPTVDLTGANLREVVTPLDASDPAWSPLLPMM